MVHATPVDPRDETWEVRAPRYRVYFYAGTAAAEYEIDAVDVEEALAWAEQNRGRRTFALYVCVPLDGLGLVRLAGADPNAHDEDEPTAREVLTSVRALADERVMRDVLTGALQPVLRDVRTWGLAEPEIGGYGWAGGRDVASAMLGGADGGGSGFWVDTTEPEESRVAAVADQVQEWVIEERQPATATSWPPCPRHPDSHPLRAEAVAGIAMWTCPTDRTPAAVVGSLPPPRSEPEQ